MFLASYRWPGGKYLVLTVEDPRDDGYSGEVTADLDLDYGEDVNRFPDGGDRPDECVGQSRENPKQYRVFRNAVELRKADFEPVEGTVYRSDTSDVFQRWSDFLKDLSPSARQ